MQIVDVLIITFHSSFKYKWYFTLTKFFASGAGKKQLANKLFFPYNITHHNVVHIKMIFFMQSLTMSIDKYRTLTAVVETKSLTRAAAELGCTQSAVSHSIDALEKELGFAVLIRSRAGVRLTEEGERLMPAVRNLLSSAEQLNQTASAIRGLESGTVRIGAFTSVAVHWLPTVLEGSTLLSRRSTSKLLNGDYHDVEQWLSDGSVDVGFVAMPSAVGCECIALMEDRLLAILPKHSRYESYPKFPLIECEHEPFISLLESSAHDARRALDAAGVKPNVRFYTKDDYAVIAMVEQGLGISIMPELLLKGRHDELQVMPLAARPNARSASPLPPGTKWPHNAAFCRLRCKICFGNKMKKEKHHVAAVRLSHSCLLYTNCLP